MIEDKDYIMRLTHEIARMLIRLIFGRDIDKEDELPVSVERLQQFKKLTAMIDDGQINEAENLLVDGLEAGNRAYFEMALMFYEKLNGKSEDFLTEHDYSQEEVLDGVKYVVDFYGYSSLMEAFVDEEGLR